MKKDKALLWTKALRGNYFTQGFGQLFKQDKHCVLSVLATLAMSEGVCDFDLNGSYDGKLKVLPESVVEWAGMRSRTGTVPDEFLSLSGLNDLAEWDFFQLAQVIEENYESL